MTDKKVPTISAGGMGFMIFPADIGYADLYTRTDGMLLEDAVSESKRKTDKIIEAIKSSVREVTAIVVTDVQIGETKPSWRESKESPKPEVIKNILVKIPPSPELAVKIVDMASRMGAFLQNPLATSYSGDPASAVLYGLLDRDGAEESVLKKAVEDARANAARLAKQLGKNVGRILEVSKIEIVTAGSGSLIRRHTKSKFSTDYLSVTPERVELIASLVINFELEG